VWPALSLNGPGAILDPGNDLRRRFGRLKLLLFANQSGGGFDKISVLLFLLSPSYFLSCSIQFRKPSRPMRLNDMRLNES
jgi:hypothetical protein